MTLTVESAHGTLTVQDDGRVGFVGQGVSRGGAADRLALAEGAALLNQPKDLAVLEMAGAGGVFVTDEPLRIALTGASMNAKADGVALAWNASHMLPAGTRLEIGGATTGSYGYLHVGGGLDTPEILGSRSTHLTAGLGAPLSSGDRVNIGVDEGTETGQRLDIDDRFSGGTLRIVETAQSDFFSQEQKDAMVSSELFRSPQGNRMGVRLDGDAEGLGAEGGLTVISEIISPGDVQMTGSGLPFILLYDCQTTGGYPRIATVIPADMPRAAQAAPGVRLRLQWVSIGEAVDAERKFRCRIKALRGECKPLVRDPAAIPDLLSYQLVSGVTAGTD